MIILTESQKNAYCKLYGNYYLGAVSLNDGTFGVNEWEATAPPLPVEVKEALTALPIKNVLEVDILKPIR